MARQPSAKKKRLYDPEALRARVLDVAAAEFQSRGYHSTSTHDIMRSAGVSGGALHHHFPTKKSLGLAVIRERVVKAVEQAWIDPVKSGNSAADGILSAFEQVAQNIDERGAVLGCPLGNLALELSLTDTDFRTAIDEIYEGWFKTIAQKIRQDRGAGIIDVDPETFSTLVISSYSGALTLAKARQHSEPLRACARQLARAMGKPPKTRKKV
ncbi:MULTISPECIES: TetR/AcrR family transcriptional regulator [unclassified Bradyrhizobium]|uniref:TetR/AcrR family transcriptional regulator n=1 Tax=unclassified Bradyrhizobium TaxID=2631580 RepID=UPI001FFAADC0|nr:MULTISPECIES: TetR/AcrR family transcriptional regulator [unclassified Bradyrhizobium]MCK1344501.1 TetR/AcrR family transcriptional regulator [Bradyrhizobium sp. CW11]MCK1591083.1 TetR/AcrR family transcriptional regulator [Bradyrhizobium sp. 169]